MLNRDQRDALRRSFIEDLITALERQVEHCLGADYAEYTTEQVAVEVRNRLGRIADRLAAQEDTSKQHCTDCEHAETNGGPCKGTNAGPSCSQFRPGPLRELRRVSLRSDHGR